MGYSIDAIADNCYEGTSCLINKLDIRDDEQLSIMESHITLAKISMLQQNPINGDFGFEHYKSIHYEHIACVDNRLPGEKIDGVWMKKKIDTVPYIISNKAS